MKKNDLKRMASVVLLLLMLITFASCNQANTDEEPSNPADENNALITEDRIDAGCVEVSAPEATLDMDEDPEGLMPALVVSNTSASAGETVKIVVTIRNNPGIAGAKLMVTYDSRLTLTGVDEGSAFEFLDYTAPASLKSGCALNWDSLLGEATEDGIVVSFTFRVADTVSDGNILEIACSYIDGDVYDENIQDVSLACINGSITINS